MPQVGVCYVSCMHSLIVGDDPKKDLAGMTALHWCVLRGHEISARLLLDRGAEVDVLQKVRRLSLCDT